MIREIAILSFNRKPEHIVVTKKREVERLENAILNIETFYIVMFLRSYLRKDKTFKDLSKNINKENRITKIFIFIDAPKNHLWVNGKYVEYQITDTYDQIKLLRGINRANKILEIVSKSANEFEQYIPGIKESLNEAIDSFKQAGYRNIWIHQKKRLKGIGTVKLVCEISIFEFTLDVVVEKKDKEIYKKRLITTLPDSLFWHSMFKALIISEDEISVTDRIYEKPFFTISVKDMLANKNGKLISLYQNDEVKENLGVTSTRKSEHFEAFKNCMQTPEGIPCPKFGE